MSNSKNHNYILLTKIFDISLPYSIQIIELILTKNNDKLIFRNNNSKKIYNYFPTQTYEGNQFELILTNSENYYCSVLFEGFGLEGEIGVYKTKEDNYLNILQILFK